MSYKKSFSTVEKNKDVWSNNLVKFQESHRNRGSILLEVSSLTDKCRIPLTTHIVGRYQFLGEEIKGRKQRVTEIAKEIISLGKNKLNFPHVSDQAVHSRIDKVMKPYDECIRRGKYDHLKETFDITKVNGMWLSLEDKRLYHLQLKSKGKIGYSEGKLASAKTIHPSKR